MIAQGTTPPPEPQGSPSVNRLRLPALAAILALALVMLAVKAFDEGWFEPLTPLDLTDGPVILFFNRHKGCECELVVYEAAERQIQSWLANARPAARLIPIDLDRRPDLGKQFSLVRVPALLLVDREGKILYAQKESVSDTAPLNLPALERFYEKVTHGK